MENLFETALLFVLKWEGGYVNNKYDKGGATNYGITQNTYNNWLMSQKLPSKMNTKQTYFTLLFILKNHTKCSKTPHACQ